MIAHRTKHLCRRVPLAVAVAAALTGLPLASALAQDATPAPAAQTTTAAPAPDAKKDAAVLDAVIVTAGKRAQNVREVPASISVIGGQQLEDQHVAQLSDLQASVPDLYVNSNGTPGKTTVSLRGISPISSGATIGTYFDETPLGSSGLYQAANFFALDLLPYDIARIEVLRGPQGTLYGAGSMGGLIKYVSIEPDPTTREFQFGGGLSSVKGSGDTGWDVRFGANLPLVSDALALRVSYARNDLPGYIDNSTNGRDDINSGSQTSARAALRWQGDSASVDVTAMRQTIDSDNNAQVALDPITRKPLDGDLTNNILVDEPFTKDVDFYSATVNWDLGWSDFVSATGYSRTNSLTRQDSSVQYGEIANLLLGLPAPGSSYFDLGLDLDKFTQEFRLVSKPDAPFEWMVGAFYTKEDATQTQTLKLNQVDGSALPAPFDSFGTVTVLQIPSTYKEKAVFADGAYAFNDVFKVDAGVRYAQNDQHFSQNVTAGFLLPIGQTPNDSSEGVFTWSLSPQFKLSQDAMLYARVATGYQPGGPNVLVPGLPSAVDSSTLTNYELGLKSQFDDRRVTLDLTGFYIDWSDIQVASIVNGVSGLINAGKASSRGVEAATLFKLTDRFELGLNAAYTDSKLDEDFPTIVIPISPTLEETITSGLAGDRLSYVPKWAWTGTANYFVPVNANWTAQVGGALRWVGDRASGTTVVTDINDTSTTPPTVLQSTAVPAAQLDSYWALDFNASLANEHWTLRGYVHNLTDERGYQSISDVSSALTGVTSKLVAAPIQPRTFGLEVDYRF